MKVYKTNAYGDQKTYNVDRIEGYYQLVQDLSNIAGHDMQDTINERMATKKPIYLEGFGFYFMEE